MSRNIYQISQQNSFLFESNLIIQKVFQVFQIFENFILALKHANPKGW